MNRHELIVHSNQTALAGAVASQVGEILASAISTKRHALAFVPGGSTPKAIFPPLARTDIDWAKVTLLPSDERVSSDSRYSNYAAARRAFEATEASVLPLIEGGGGCEEAAANSESRLQSLRWPPDLIWLGLGADGHFASIFPGKAGAHALTCESARAVCARPDPLPSEAPFPRVTLTLPAILSAESILIAATGDAKKSVIDAAFAGRGDHLPISALLREAQQTIIVHWSPA